MPEARLARTRRAYAPDRPKSWRRPSDTAAEQLTRRGLSAMTPPVCGPGAQYGPHVTANVIEGDHFESDHKESTT